MNTARQLTVHLADLLRQERGAMAEFLIALAAFDKERRWAELGHASLFSFLHRELGLAKDSAFQRMTAARLVQNHPEAMEPLRDGRLTLSTAVEVAKVITPENRGEVLPRYFHLSKREAKVVTAELQPCEAAPHRTVVVPVRAEPAAAALTLTAPRPERAVRLDEPGPPSEPLTQPSPRSAGRGVDASPGNPPLAQRPVPSDVVPLTAALSRMHVTVSRRFLEKLAAAKAALSHSVPGGNEEAILEAGLDLLLERAAKRRGLVERPRPEPKPSTQEGYIPAHVKRAVWKRDQGRCQFPLEGGGVCGSTHQVEFDHVIPRARGGPSTVANVRLACRVHNFAAAREVFGHAWMDRYTRGGVRRSSEALPPP